MGNGDRVILIVEDNSALSNLLKHVFTTAGYAVMVSANGREAWTAIQTVQFDMIVTDYQMPEMSGIELCERLRETADYATTPVIMITGKGLELDLPQLRESLGIAATFMKPFSPKEVVRTVENYFALAT